MKTATFTYKGNPTGNRVETINGTVTLKNDGKVSVSLFNAKDRSYAAKYHAKLLAKEIVDANFVHVAIVGNVNGNQQDDTLVTILLEKTAGLKADLLEKTKVYANIMWEHMTKFVESYKTKKHDYNSREYMLDRNKNLSYRKIIAAGKEAFLAVEIKVAEEHHMDCTEKLAYRLNEKGLKNIADLKIIDGRVGVNLEMVFKFNDIIVTAKTIIAEGPIQRAHYRYLVK